MTWLVLVTIICVVMSVTLRDAASQPSTAVRQASASQSAPPVFAPLTPWMFPKRDAVNPGTVTIVTAPAGGACVMFGSEMERVLDENDSLRVLPVISKGPVPGQSHFRTGKVG